MKRALALGLMLLATTVNATELAPASARESLGSKPQWAPSGNFSALHTRAVFREEFRSESRPYARESRGTAAGSGIFLSRDSVGAQSYLSSPNALGPWSYANGSPLRYTDPDGRAAACFEGEDHARCRARLIATGRLEGSLLQPNVPETFVHPLEAQSQRAMAKTEQVKRHMFIAGGVGLTLAGGSGIALLAAEGNLSLGGFMALSMSTEAASGALIDKGLTGEVHPETVLMSAILGPLGTAKQVPAMRSAILEYQAAKAGLSASAATIEAELLHVEAREALSSTISEAQAVAARRQAWAQLEERERVLSQLDEHAAAMEELQELLHDPGRAARLYESGAVLNMAGRIPAPARAPINVRHIFHGEINRRGNAVGFHHRGGIGWQQRARLVPGTETAPNAQGVFQANVEVFDSARDVWVRKNAPSTFFPDAWGRPEVLDQIQGAFAVRNRVPLAGRPANYWEGLSPSGITIGGYVGPAGEITTAFPIRVP